MVLEWHQIPPKERMLGWGNMARAEVQGLWLHQTALPGQMGSRGQVVSWPVGRGASNYFCALGIGRGGEPQAESPASLTSHPKGRCLCCNSYRVNPFSSPTNLSAERGCKSLILAVVVGEVTQ